MTSIFTARAKYRDWVKPAIDRISAACLIALLLPLLLAIAVAVRIRIGSPVLFAQVRPGKDEVPFRLVKFRTMSDACDSAGNLLPDEVRLTNFGKWLRSTSLDELPELLNILRGEMSLVGPRPLLMEYLALYTPEQSRRQSVRPGLTGLAQVNGRNLLSWEEKFARDVEYVERISFRLDMRILGQTVSSVIRRAGVSAPSHCTMPPFRGSKDLIQPSRCDKTARRTAA